MAVEFQIAGMWAGALVGLLALFSYIRTGDPSRGLVAMAFATNVAWALSDVARWTGVGPHEQLFRLAVVFSLTRGYVLLLLARRVAPVPRRWLVGTAVASLLFVPAAVLLPRPHSVWWFVPYCVVLLVPVVRVTMLFAAEARHRGGWSGTRLWLTAAGCGAFTLWSLTLVVGRAGGFTLNLGQYALVPVSPVGEVLVLLSAAGLMLLALGFVLTFMPPRWLRQAWAAAAAHEVSRRVLALPADAAPQRVWQQYADAVAEASSGDAVAVVVGRDVSVLAVRHPEESGAANDLRAVAESAAHRDATRPDVIIAGDVRWVPLVDQRIDGGAMAVMNRRQGLFDRDDLLAFATAAAEAAVLAERGRLLAEQRRLLVEQRRLSDELGEALAEQRRTDEFRSQFLAATSHELRTPLNAIIGFSDLVLSNLAEDDLNRPFMEHVHTGGRRLLHLINDLLDLSKVGSGRMDLQMSPTRLDELVRQTVGMLEPLWRGKVLQVSHAVPDITADVDPFRFRQVLENLLSNAIKFTPEGGAITVSGAVGVQGAALHVADPGPGIAPESQDLVFQEFQQVGEPDSRSQGTGLGLTLARQIARAHGGDITLDSTVGQGSTFTVTLPVSCVVDTAAPGWPGFANTEVGPTGARAAPHPPQPSAITS
ncbi:HAMP domain-containing sensor histidine kinase [Pilimelia columellifera]|uniref:histidine kinase n=1 Tax=Pilimelia columellifera subsp. columellifera TaxID=706583 RepID=A0ABN3NN88_9ACTN